MERKLVVGNWKMHGSRAANAGLLAAIVGARPYGAEVAVCVPCVFLGDTAAQLAGSEVQWGAQDVSAHAQGAYTGEVSAAMLAEYACRFALVGHSERRQYHAESDELVAAKAQAALAQGITPIVCVGETLGQRDAGLTEAVVARQLAAVAQALGARLADIVLAYEPVWAIGTGRTATPAQAQSVHAALRMQLQTAGDAAARVRVLYGGSVKADNAAELLAMPDIDGALVGGASLKAAEFIAICRAAG